MVEPGVLGRVTQDLADNWAGSLRHGRLHEHSVARLHPALAQHFLFRVLLDDVVHQPVLEPVVAHRLHHLIELVDRQGLRLDDQGGDQLRLDVAGRPEFARERAAVQGALH